MDEQELLGWLPQDGKGQLAWLAVMQTPLGPMAAAFAGDELLMLEFAARERVVRQWRLVAGRGGFAAAGAASLAGSAGSQGAVKRLQAELDEYFAGSLREFTAPVRLLGTPFQQSVWAQLRQIPYGQTRGYQELARELGSPGAMRAVGAANGANPVAILVPCHRVVRTDSSLCGYAGGLSRKQALLELEAGEFVLVPG